MKTKMLRIILALLAVLTSGWAQAPRANLAAAEREIREADIEFSKAAGARDLERFKSFLADDVTTLRPDSPVIKGRDAFAERWAPLLANPALQIHWEPLEARMSPSGDFGYTIGRYEITRTDEKGTRVAATGKYVSIWQKQADGSWKVAHDSGVEDSPPKE